MSIANIINILTDTIVLYDSLIEINQTRLDSCKSELSDAMFYVVIIEH